MVTATHVPVHSGAALPAPSAPSVPSPNAAEFAPVPPAGDPPNMSGVAPAPNGTAHQYVGQVPGFVQNPGQLPNPAQLAVPAAPQPAQQTSPDMAKVLELLNAALGKPAQPTAQPAPAQQQPAPGQTPIPDAPAYLAQGVANFDLNTVTDPTIKMLGGILLTQGQGLNLDRAVGNALARGDVSLIDAAYLKEAAGDRAPALLELARGLVTAVTAHSAKVTSEIHQIVGGEAVWNASVAAFNKNAPRELRLTVANMLDNPNSDFIKAGAKIIAEYGAASGQVPQPGSGQLNFAAGQSLAQGLSKVQFQSELQKLDRNAPDYEQSRASLFARRQSGKQAGL